MSHINCFSDSSSDQSHNDHNSHRNKRAKFRSPRRSHDLNDNTDSGLNLGETMATPDPPQRVATETEVEHARHLCTAYLKSRMGYEETNESISLVQSYQPPSTLPSGGYELVTKQSLHVRVAKYIGWVKKIQFYQQLDHQLSTRSEQKQEAPT